MKKLLTLAALVSATALSHGQGLVNFANSVTASTHISTNLVNSIGGPAGGAAAGQTVAVANQYYFELLMSSTATTVDGTFSGWTPVALGANTASTGRFNGNPTTAGTPIVNTNPGDHDNFVVVGWSANLGTDWTTASAWWNNGDPSHGPGTASGWFGYTATPAVGYVMAGGLNPLNALFGTAANQVTGFTLNYYPVPEPGTLALAGLGLAGMMIFRRRK